MIIKELNSNTGLKSAVIQLDYDECRDIANGLYMLTHCATIDSDMSDEKKQDYIAIWAKMQTLFSLVKSGCVDCTTIKAMYERLNEHLNEPAPEDNVNA